MQVNIIKYIVLAAICIYGCGEAINSEQAADSVQENVDSAASSDDVTSNGDAFTDVHSDG